MAISKANGREYESRRERGYKPQKRAYKAEKYPKGYDRWGVPLICGHIDPETGEECPKPRGDYHQRCDYHQELHEKELQGYDLMNRADLWRYLNRNRRSR